MLTQCETPWLHHGYRLPRGGYNLLAIATVQFPQVYTSSTPALHEVCPCLNIHVAKLHNLNIAMEGDEGLTVGLPVKYCTTLPLPEQSPVLTRHQTQCDEWLAPTHNRQR